MTTATSLRACLLLLIPGTKDAVEAHWLASPAMSDLHAPPLSHRQDLHPLIQWPETLKPLSSMTTMEALGQTLLQAPGVLSFRLMNSGTVNGETREAAQ